MALNEKKLIERIQQGARKAEPTAARLLPARLLCGIGDDCARLALPAGYETIVTTDFTIENVHFRRQWHPPEVVGHRCLARGLSDIAAMGGKPVSAFLSLALPAGTETRWVDKFLSGMLALAEKSGVALAGGDTTESPGGILADIVVLGIVPSGQAILRSGAQAGDSIHVTGELGAAMALCERMYAEPEKKYRPASCPAHFYPQPQLAIGQYLREHKLATAMIDISDGLSTELSHICEESGTGAVLWASAIPIASIGRRKLELRQALHGGDEYQLLFTSPKGRRLPKAIAGVPVTRIGEIMAGGGLLLEEAGGQRTKLTPGGWQHFDRQKTRRSKH